MKVSDYIMEFIASKGCEKVFMVAGGGGMHLIDSLGKNKRLKYVCCHHEQAAVMAAEGYQRVSGRIGCALVTTGPAATNAITGCACAWNDSIPMIILSGQANSKSLIGNTGLRQRGVHEVDIISLVKPITKMAHVCTDPKFIDYILHKAYYTATTGRPGPVWLDIPIDIQAAEMDIEFKNGGFEPDKIYSPKWHELDAQKQSVKLIGQKLISAKRPMVVLGHGIKLSHTQNRALSMLTHFNTPAVTTKLGFDLIEDSSDYLAGRIGINAQRAGNIALQNADFILVLGSRLSLPTTGYNTAEFGRNAEIAIVDVDEAVLRDAFGKFKIKYLVASDLNLFFDRLMEETTTGPARTKWFSQIKKWRDKFDIEKERAKDIKKHDTHIDSYMFYRILSKYMRPSDILVTDQGAAFYGYNPAFRNKHSQTIFTNGGFSPMGYGLPAAIGACFGKNGSNRRVVLVSGDGSMMMNLQELQTLRHHGLSILIFILSNEGYLSIKHTQDAYFPGNRVGCDKASGVSLPDWGLVAQALGISYEICGTYDELKINLGTLLDAAGPRIVEIVMNPEQAFYPKVVSKKKADGTMVSPPLEQMTPEINIRAEMIIKDKKYE